MKIQIDIPDELPIGRLNSYLKGVIDGLLPVAASHTSLDHTPEGHEPYRAKGPELAAQLIEAITAITKR